MEMKKATLSDKLNAYEEEQAMLAALEHAPPAEEEIMDAAAALEDITEKFRQILVAARIDIAMVFTSFDKDGDGMVTHKEFRLGLRKLNITLSDGMVEDLIGMMDKDGDGEIDYREFIKQFGDKCATVFVHAGSLSCAFLAAVLRCRCAPGAGSGRCRARSGAPESGQCCAQWMPRTWPGPGGA